ncbi:UNVERIFIED_CONTAM: Alcohol dehydrogenase-like 2 [Sesamum radiatum]|uniref:Alcohol dehydrogenase-like 2 n=1 Tax=Sesamum radiatum TaxID=300843 RepID=A0AAW2SJE6_SESRA
MESKCPSEMAGKPIRCRAAVARKAGEPLVVEEIDVLPPKAWEVRIKILCTSLCHSDVTIWKKDLRPAAYFPRIFGHEAVGIVESVGEWVEEVNAGVPVFQRNCGECKDCLSPKGNACSKFPLDFPGGMPRDGTTRFLDVNGTPIHHFFFVSSFSQYTVVDITHVVKIHRDFPIDKACLLGCGVTTGVGAVSKIAEVEEGSTVAIFGLGSVGLAEMTDGGVDYCFECIGLASLMQDAINSSKPELHLDEFISHEIELKDINSAFEMLQYQANSLSRTVSPPPPNFPRSMAEVDASKPQSLSEQYLLEEKEKKSDVAVKSVEEPEVKPSVDAPTEEIVQKTEETPTVVDSEVAPAATGGDSEVSDVAAGDSKETSPADANPAPSEESNDTAESENTNNQEAEETPEIKLETAPADFRFPTTNQTRHCFTRYIEYHRCIAAKGEGAPECDKFAKYYRSLCPGEWVDRWNEQRENGTFPGPL